MESLSFSLWVTLFIWILFIGVGIYRSSMDKYWKVNCNIFLYTIGLPAIFILSEYLLFR